MDSKKQLPITIYSPQSQMSSPSKLFHSMWEDMKSSKELAWRLFIRDISAQYRQSLLGVLWAFVPPIITSVIFIILQSRKVVNFGETDIPYPVYVLVGTILWQLFVESLNAPLKSVIIAKPMLAKINFPREAIIISAIYTVIFNLLIKLVVLGAILAIFKISLTWMILVAPIAIIMLMLLGISIGLLLTPLGVLYTDISTSIPIFVQLFFFVTPVVYPPPTSLPFSLLATLNPVSPALIASRDLITKGVISNMPSFLVISGLTVVLLMVGWIVFRIALPIIIERMSA